MKELSGITCKSYVQLTVLFEKSNNGSIAIPHLTYPRMDGCVWTVMSYLAKEVKAVNTFFQITRTHPLSFLIPTENAGTPCSSRHDFVTLLHFFKTFEALW